MPPKESSETKHAIFLHEVEGYTIKEAASIARVWPSTLHRAINKRAEQAGKKKVAKRG